MMIIRRLKYFFERHKLKKQLKKKPCRIIIGAHSTSQDGWISTEKKTLDLLKPSDWEEFFSENKIDAILAEHVWEHLTREEGIAAAKTCFNYLKKGGYLRVAVPDGFHPNKKYIDWVKPFGNAPKAETHKTLYNYRTLKKVFESASFKVVLLEYFDEKGKFHYKNWYAKNGLIRRSKNFDSRNKGDKLDYTSIIIDAWK